LFNWNIFLKGVTAVTIGIIAITAVIATGGAATPLVAAGLTATITAGTTSVIFGAHDICESITGENKLKETLGEPVYEVVETVSEIVSSAGTYWIASNPQAFNSYYETEPGPSGNSLCEDDFDDDPNATVNSNSNSASSTETTKEYTPQEKGKIGEELAGIDKNTEKITINGHDRIPDELNTEEKIVGEVKNVNYQSYTSQLRDDVSLVENKGYSMNLYVRDTTVLSKPLTSAIKKNNINVVRFEFK